MIVVVVCMVVALIDVSVICCWGLRVGDLLFCALFSVVIFVDVFFVGCGVCCRVTCFCDIRSRVLCF